MGCRVSFSCFFFLSRKLLPPPSRRRGSRRPRVRALLRQHEAANSLPPTLLPLFLSRLSLCRSSGSHRHGERPPSVLVRRANSIFITSRSHTSQSAGEAPSCTLVSPGLEEILRGRELRRGIYSCIMPLTHAFSHLLHLWRGGTHLFPPSAAHSLCLCVSCAVQLTAARSTRTLIVRYSEPSGSSGSRPRGRTLRGQMEEFLNPVARIFLKLF